MVIICYNEIVDFLRGEMLTIKLDATLECISQ